MATNSMATRNMISARYRWLRFGLTTRFLLITFLAGLLARQLREMSATRLGHYQPMTTIK